MFTDSWERLKWVHTLVARVTPLVEAANVEGRRGDLTVTFADWGGFRHARFARATAVPIPHELGFIVGDIAVNARSCLDMAVQQLVTARNIPVGRKSGQFQFPISVGPTSVERKIENFPEAVKASLRSLQPDAVHPTLGRLDPPMNSELLQLRSVSNAAKHRNLTPVVRVQHTTGFVELSTIALSGVDSADDSPWPRSDATVLEVRWRGLPYDDPQVEHLKVLSQRALYLEGVQVAMPSGRIARINVADFLGTIPSYVRRVLHSLESAVVA